MYYFFSLLAGILIAVMVAVNGGLVGHTGMYSGVVMIHVSGLAIITVITLIKREWPFAKRQAWYLYLGGAIGVATIVFNSLAFGRISVSAMLALGLLGESVTGLVVDQYGLLGMPRHPFLKWKAAGLLLIAGGIVSMVSTFVLLPVLVSFLCGVNIVISRTLNAKLASRTSIRVSTFFNYLVGTSGAVLLYLLLGRQETGFSHFALSPDLHIYLGGALGVCIVLVSNHIVMKVPALYLSLLLFTGQVFASVIIDAIIAQAFSLRILMGGVFVAAGLCVNLMIDRRKTKVNPA
ncbi:MAG: DMT family transporter [Oscillospiraceae bacterium]|jgi:transporter family-2 protein|nr:DMT family transporter [Oscillospiraceae bacterium]